MGKLVSLAVIFFLSLNIFSQSITTTHIYKKVDTIELKFKIYKPYTFDSNKEYSTVILFHGGGFNNRFENQFKKHAEYFNSRSYITITPVYRIKNLHNTSPRESYDDAKDFLNYIILNSKKYNINVDRLFIGGGSAGGHLALSTIFQDNTRKFVKGLILYNPIVDTGPNSAFANRRNNKDFLEISPIHNIKEGHPPTIIFHGSLDKIEPIEKINEYKEKVSSVGSRCEVIIYPNQGHSFFNQQEFFIKTCEEVDKFLLSLNYLNKSF